MKFDNEAEEDFYDFLNDFELTSMVQKIESQVKMQSGSINRRVDFVLTLNNGEKIYLEVDGSTHKEKNIVALDEYKDWYANRIGANTLRIKFSDFFKDREKVANVIESMIELLSGN